MTKTQVLVHIEKKVRSAAEQGGLAYIYIPFDDDKTMEILSHAANQEWFDLMGYTVRVHKRPEYNSATNKVGIFLMVKKHD